jgi:hypothetical protein
VNQDQIDAGFAHVRSERFLRAHAGQVRDPAFWRGLNPQLTITERPLSVGIDPLRVDAAVAARAARQIVDEGYFHAPSVIPPARLAALRVGAERVVAAGLPSGFTCVYDEFYQAFHGLEALFAPLLGERYLMVLQGLWTYVVPAGDPAYRQWTTVAPHRDTLGPDPRVVARGTPSIINVWIPLTDVSTIDSCVYAVPAPGDPDYYSPDRRVRPERFRLQDIRALPAAAGSVLGWSTHLVHWGSRSSAFAAGPRIAITVYFQRRDAARLHPATVELDAPIPFDARLSWIGASLGIADVWKSAGERHA